jgi:hypothetical protein
MALRMSEQETEAEIYQTIRMQYIADSKGNNLLHCHFVYIYKKIEEID